MSYKITHNGQTVSNGWTDYDSALERMLDLDGQLQEDRGSDSRNISGEFQVEEE